MKTPANVGLKIANISILEKLVSHIVRRVGVQWDRSVISDIHMAFALTGRDIEAATKVTVADIDIH